MILAEHDKISTVLLIAVKLEIYKLTVFGLNISHTILKHSAKFQSPKWKINNARIQGTSSA